VCVRTRSSSVGITAGEASELVLSRLKAERNDPLDQLVRLQKVIGFS